MGKIKNKLAYYRKKADTAMQEWGRNKYSRCLACGNPMSCLHHYHPKSVSSALRYDEDNLIPICAGCHLKHHKGNPTIHNEINKKKGQEWIDKLEKKKYNPMKINIGYYKEIIELYKNNI